jgi:hypothetical protein
LSPTPPQPRSPPWQSTTLPAVGSVRRSTHPAGPKQSPLAFSFSDARQRSRKKAQHNPIYKRSMNQRLLPNPRILDNWFQGISDSPFKRLRHGPVWETEASTQVEPSCASTLAINSVTMLPHIRSPSVPDESFETPSICHTCAPPPGWIVVNGITIPPPICAPDIIQFEEDESDLAAWFCTKCYLDPIEKPLDFELCISCLENYYFPFPPVLPKDWVCPGCKGLDRGESHAYRQCHHFPMSPQVD